MDGPVFPIPPAAPLPTSYKLSGNGVVRTRDGVFIPRDPDNIHWREYEAWLDDGHSPEPADPPPPEEGARRARRQALRAYSMIQRLETATPAEIDAWIDANVTTIAQARTVLKALCVAMSVLLREGL